MINSYNVDKANDYMSGIDDYTSGFDDYTSGDISIENKSNNEIGYTIMIFLFGMSMPILMILLAILLAYKKQRTIRRYLASNSNIIA
jgi:hypothetical protein